jgi:basic membrane lipoprotein Med (substrate-binding protein (PBP1-ABC) superfamily)
MSTRAETAAGSFKGEFIRYGVKEGALDIVLNPKLAPNVPDAAIAAVDEARAAIRAGTLEVPFVAQ